MNFRELCEGCEEISGNLTQTKRARRKIWTSNVNIQLGVVHRGSPVAIAIRKDDRIHLRIGMNLLVDGTMAIIGWCPPVEDVMGQDWMFIEGR